LKRDFQIRFFVDLLTTVLRRRAFGIYYRLSLFGVGNASFTAAAKMAKPLPFLMQ